MGDDELDALLECLSQTLPQVVFAQVGANDGVYVDPLREFVLRFGWKGVLVEPVKYLFDKLVSNYTGVPGLTFENAVISDVEGPVEFYYLNESDDLPDWHVGLGSLRRDTIMWHVSDIPDLESRLITIEVPSLTLNSLLEKHGIDDLQMLQIDAEGYDFGVLKTIDLERYTPTLICLEHKHLPEDERIACWNLLSTHGYELKTSHIHTCALSKTSMADYPALSVLWHQLGHPGGL